MPPIEQSRQPLLSETDSVDAFPSDSHRRMRLGFNQLLRVAKDEMEIHSQSGTNRRSRMIRAFAMLLLLGSFVVFVAFFYTSYNRSTTASLLPSWNVPLSVSQDFAARNLIHDVGARFKAKVNSSVVKLFNKRNLSWSDIWSASGKRQQSFEIDGRDVLVFLHMQKTAGTTFERFLTRQLDLQRPCQCAKGRKRCLCLRPSHDSEWLFSRMTTGWTCGLHADWTELAVSNCVDNVMDARDGVEHKRRYFFSTLLRDPVARYISEYTHVARGATWSGALHYCDGRVPTPNELPMCFDPEEGWANVSLDEFLACPFNLANNRQTRMLADLTLIGCYNGSRDAVTDKIMLNSAKHTLEGMAFFGLTEDMPTTQMMFEETFDLRFKEEMQQKSLVESKSSRTPVSDAQLQLMKRLNALDIELYEFAAELFKRRRRQLALDELETRTDSNSNNS